MRIFIPALLTFFASATYSQSLSISADSTQVVFPDNVVINMSRSGKVVPRGFQISTSNLKVLITEINFLLNRLKLEQDNVALYRENEDILRSTAIVMEKKYLGELERTQLHKRAYEELVNVSAAYQTELENCRTDLQELSRENNKRKKGGFLKGMIWGAIIGGVLGLAVDAAVD